MKNRAGYRAGPITLPVVAASRTAAGAVVHALVGLPAWRKVRVIHVVATVAPVLFVTMVGLTTSTRGRG